MVATTYWMAWQIVWYHELPPGKCQAKYKIINQIHGQENDYPFILNGLLENVLVCAQFTSKLGHGT